MTQSLCAWDSTGFGRCRRSLRYPNPHNVSSPFIRPCQMGGGKGDWYSYAKTAKVRATRLVLDPYLLKYFNKRKTYFAHDALQQCTVGDIVLLRALPVPRSKHVKHELAEIVYKVGRIIDPVTGKPCAGTAYLESPLSSETTHLSKNLEELKISSTQ